MKYWKKPVQYLLKTIAAFTAYFILAWAFSWEKYEIDGRIVYLPVIIAQTCALLAVILTIKTILSVIAEVSLWRIMRRPLSNTPGQGTPRKSADK